MIFAEDRGIGLKDWLAGQRSKSVHSEKKAAETSLQKNRVAVLPLVNMISDPTDEYFSDGMTEELISTLANLSGLQVISRTSIMQYKNTQKKAAEIGRELMAGTIIEGSVRKAGRRVRISVQLIDAQEDKHLWAQSYDRQLEDVFAVQGDIARNVAEALKIKLLPRESVRIEKKATHSMEAYSLYLKGRYHWNKRTGEGVEKAIEDFQSAINLDPNYALAYAGLADCYNIQANYQYTSLEEAYSKARKAAVRAIELDNGVAEAHASLALSLMHDWKWTAAMTEFKSAIELSPNYASAHQWYALLLRILSRQDEALTEVRKAQAIDPISPVITSNVGDVLYVLGQYDSAMEQYKKALEIEPNFIPAHVGMLGIFVDMSKFGEALKECQKIDTLTHSDLRSQGNFAYLHARAGRKEEAIRFLEINIKAIETNRLYSTGVAILYSALGDKDNALAWLMRGFEWHDSALPFINEISASDPLSPVRSDPRFIMLLRKMNLQK